MRAISQTEAESMRTALKQIASYWNPARDQTRGSQASARQARQVLEDLGLYLESDARDR